MTKNFTVWHLIAAIGVVAAGSASYAQTAQEDQQVTSHASPSAVSPQARDSRALTPSEDQRTSPTDASAPGTGMPSNDASVTLSSESQQQAQPPQANINASGSTSVSAAQQGSVSQPAGAEAGAGASVSAEGQAEPSADMKQASGQVSAIDPQANELTLRSGLFGMATSDFQLGVDSIITEGGRRLQLTELQVGDEVTIEYMPQDGRNVARVIAVKEKQPSTAG